ncbi:MAG: M20/M25/M40 family metallo-hydrolase [Gammaproteobacteria bacterium]|nr:M20/M25/M40 family metallo-hydrolase [Gammaproteobacteria bacterium]
MVTLVVALLFVPLAQAREAATPHEQKALEIYRKIVSIPTWEGNGKVPQMAAYLADEFRQAGFAEDDIRIVPHGETAVLVVRYRAPAGKRSGPKPILLMAHMDVVPAKRTDWERDPFTLVEEDGFFFGRGTSDNKAGVAHLTATFLRLKAEKFVPSRDLVIFFSGDEETTAESVQAVIRDHRELIDAEYALNSDGGGGELGEADGKPTMFLVQGAEKTFASFNFTVRNAGGHSSRPRPDNAIYELADVLKRVQAYRFPVMSNEWTLANLTAASQATPGPIGDALKSFVANPREGAAAETLASQSEYVGLTRTTCVATMLEGGHADNALPQSATATVNCRIFPGTAVQSVHETLQQLAGDTATVEVLDNPSATDASPLRKDVMASVARVVHSRFPGLPIVGYMSAGATDGKYFRGAGIPVYGVSFLYSKGSEEFAHGLNERVRVDEFYRGLEDWGHAAEGCGGEEQPVGDADRGVSAPATRLIRLLAKYPSSGAFVVA